MRNGAVGEGKGRKGCRGGGEEEAAKAHLPHFIALVHRLVELCCALLCNNICVRGHGVSVGFCQVLALGRRKLFRFAGGLLPFFADLQKRLTVLLHLLLFLILRALLRVLLLLVPILRTKYLLRSPVRLLDALCGTQRLLLQPRDAICKEVAVLLHLHPRAFCV